MELQLRVIVVLLILLIATLIFAAMILGWGGQAQLWFNQTFGDLGTLVLGR
jgi:hypothetical protein